MSVRKLLLGGEMIDALYLGDVPLSAVYLGDHLVWSNSGGNGGGDDDDPDDPGGNSGNEGGNSGNEGGNTGGNEGGNNGGEGGGNGGNDEPDDPPVINTTTATISGTAFEQGCIDRNGSYPDYSTNSDGNYHLQYIRMKSWIALPYGTNGRMKVTATLSSNAQNGGDGLWWYAYCVNRSRYNPGGEYKTQSHDSGSSSPLDSYFDNGELTGVDLDDDCYYFKIILWYGGSAQYPIPTLSPSDIESVTYEFTDVS